MHTFRNLCQGKYFVIPENQRGFSWKKNHVQDLFHDLLLVQDHAHYLGPIIVSRTATPDFLDDEHATVAEFTLEDGQQRLTSFMIIANELRKRSEELELPAVHAQDLARLIFYSQGSDQLRLQNKNADLMQHYSYLIRGTPAPPSAVSPPMNALARVKDFVTNFVTDLNSADLIHWKNRILNQAKFIWVDLASERVNRYLAFDAINSRGLPLSEFDKIKNFCILVDQTRTLNSKPDDCWYKAIQFLAKFEVDSRSQEEAFIAELYSVFHDDPVNQNEVHKKFVDEYRTLLDEADPAKENQFKSFVSYWESYAHAFGFVSTSRRTQLYDDANYCSKATGAWLDRIDNMNYLTITRTILATGWLCQKDSFEEIAKVCEVYTFRIYGVMNFRTNKNRSSIIKLANEILRNGKDLNHIVTTICEWLGQMAPMSKFIETLGDGKPKYYFDNLTKGWSSCYYFLYEYELFCSPAGVAPLAWAQSKNDKVNTQEHILPQSHRDGNWWEAHWPDQLAADKYKHRLGNLVLTAGNSVLRRKSIELKINDPEANYDFSCNDATNSEKKIAEFTDGQNWLVENIMRREVSLLKFAVERWALNCCCDNVTFNLPTEFHEYADDHSITINETNCYGQNEAIEVDEDVEAVEFQMLPDEDEI